MRTTPEVGAMRIASPGPSCWREFFNTMSPCIPPAQVTCRDHRSPSSPPSSPVPEDIGVPPAQRRRPERRPTHSDPTENGRASTGWQSWQGKNACTRTTRLFHKASRTAYPQYADGPLQETIVRRLPGAIIAPPRNRAGGGGVQGLGECGLNSRLRLVLKASPALAPSRADS